MYQRVLILHGLQRTLQRLPECIRALETVGGSFRDRSQDRVIDSRRQSWMHFHRRLWGLGQVRRHDGKVTVCIERSLTGEHFVERDPQRVQIGPLVNRFALDLLRRHVVQRAQRRTGGGKFGGFALAARDAEIHQFHRAVGRQHHVGRFDVAMNDMPLVRITERAQYLVEIFQRIGHRDGAMIQPGRK